jgi:dTDP-4-amino-4,6-dideoxy-D-glucose acyltransferase
MLEIKGKPNHLSGDQIMYDFDTSKLKHCGEDVRIGSNTIIKYPELVSIGSHVAIDPFCYITTALEIGDYVHIAPFVSIIGGRNAVCIIKHFSGIAAGSRIICGSDDFLGSGLTGPTVPTEYHADLIFKPVILEKFVIIGTNCIIHPGANIGEGAAVGSASLITKNLEPWYLYTGIPVKPVRPREREKMLEMEARLRRERG